MMNVKTLIVLGNYSNRDKHYYPHAIKAWNLLVHWPVNTGDTETIRAICII